MILLRRFSIICLVGSVFLGEGHAVASGEAGSGWKVLDHRVLPAETTVDGFRVGGLSGLAYNKKTGSLWAVSDARKWKSSVLFEFSVSLSDAGKLQIAPLGTLRLQESGRLEEPLDAEGIALWTHRRVFISHEGSKSGRLAPGIACFSMRTGHPLFSFPLPEYFYPGTSGDAFGLQKNRGFEGLTLPPGSARSLYAVNESPLIQDLNSAGGSQRGPVRILRFDLKNREALPEQRGYIAENDGVFTSVVELLALDETRLLVLERQILLAVPPRARRFRIFEVDFAQSDATDIAGLSSLRGKKIQPLRKTLLFDSLQAGLRHVDNIEGLTRGPDFQGRPTLLLVSDDNFSPSQQTEFWLLQPDFTNAQKR